MNQRVGIVLFSRTFSSSAGDRSLTASEKADFFFAMILLVRYSGI